MDTNSPKIILVADDYEPNRRLVEKLLTIERHRVIHASNGREAYFKTLEDRPDLVLLDANMPEMDGYEVLAAIKRNRSTRSIPVLMISGLDGANDRRQALELGAYDYITKPLRLDEFNRVSNPVWKRAPLVLFLAGLVKVETPSPADVSDGLSLGFLHDFFQDRLQEHPGDGLPLTEGLIRGVQGCNSESARCFTLRKVAADDLIE